MLKPTDVEVGNLQRGRHLSRTPAVLRPSELPLRDLVTQWQGPFAVPSPPRDALEQFHVPFDVPVPPRQAFDSRRRSQRKILHVASRNVDRLRVIIRAVN